MERTRNLTWMWESRTSQHRTDRWFRWSPHQTFPIHPHSPKCMCFPRSCHEVEEQFRMQHRGLQNWKIVLSRNLGLGMLLQSKKGMTLR